MSKGSSRRRQDVPEDTVRSNWERTFGTCEPIRPQFPHEDAIYFMSGPDPILYDENGIPWTRRFHPDEAANDVKADIDRIILEGGLASIVDEGLTISPEDPDED
jgi:hypothetical protein